MPTIQLTNNTTLDITATAAGGGATLNRYLTNPLTYTTAGLNAIAATTVGDLDPTIFPVAASATGGGEFAVAGTLLNVNLGASASVDLLTGDNGADFFDSLQLTQAPAVAGVVSFRLLGTLNAGDTAAVGDFCFGISKSAAVTLTTFCMVAATDVFVDALERAMAAITIPHDVQDLVSLPANTICQIAASSSLQFTASVTYDILNDPLATVSIPNLPSVTVNATAGATIEGAATHTSDHTVTIAKLPTGLIHLSVILGRTDDFETSLTVSAGGAAGVGSFDALSLLLNIISPNSTAELTKIQADLPAGQAQELGDNIKAAIDAVLCSSVQASLKAALEESQSNRRLFLYEIDLTALDEVSTAALQSALAGDFTAITSLKAKLAGIRELNSALTVCSSVKHSLTLHLLGIFNWGSTSDFVEKSKIGYTKDTHEIVLSDERIEVATNNLDAEKLREVVVKGITLTLPASANTPEAAMPIHMVYLDREAATNRSTMRQFVNVLQATGAPDAARANSLLNQNLTNYGASSLSLRLDLTPQQCRQLFVDSAGRPFDWTVYLGYVCKAEAAILDGDKDNADRLTLFTAGQAFWQALSDAGAPATQTQMLTDRGIRPNAIVDVTTLIWWSSAMQDYAKALVAGKSLVGAGKEVVKDSTFGFNEPWLILAVWNMLKNPALESLLTSSLLKPAGVFAA